MTDHGFVKALSVNNVAELVYARQFFSEPGMLEGFYLQRMYDEVVAIPDAGWLVWRDRGNASPLYEVLEDEEFRDRFVLYDQLPDRLKSVADSHPDYDEWCDIQDRLYDDKLKEKEPCPKN